MNRNDILTYAVRVLGPSFSVFQLDTLLTKKGIVEAVSVQAVDCMSEHAAEQIEAMVSAIELPDTSRTFAKVLEEDYEVLVIPHRKAERVYLVLIQLR